MRTVVFLAVVLAGVGVRATEPELINDGPSPLMEISLQGSHVRRSGDLTSDSTGGQLDFGLRLFNSPRPGFAGRSFLEVKMFFQQFKADTLLFPFANDETIRMGAFGLISNVSMWHDDLDIFFVGVGPAVVTLSQTEPKDSSQSYGTFLWQLGYRRDLNEKWSVGAQVEWFTLDSVVFERESSFRSFSTGLRVGYVLK